MHNKYILKKLISFTEYIHTLSLLVLVAIYKLFVVWWWEMQMVFLLLTVSLYVFVICCHIDLDNKNAIWGLSVSIGKYVGMGKGHTIW